MNPPKILDLKSIQRATAKVAGSHAKALDQMASAASAIAAALGVRESSVLAYVADQRTNLRVYGAS